MNETKLENALAHSFPKIRRISETIGNIIGLVVIGILFWVYHYFDWPIWVYWVLVGLVILTIIGFIWSIFEPTYLYRSWSYQFDDEYLQLSYGIFQKEWVTVPMTKIQSVTTSQGPIMKRYNVRSIKVETVGSSHAIPALEEDVALALRERLAEFAKLKEVDE
ncbi:PH domain-containing protein [Paucisalibacillus sp. EB02]|uniref:PH domain-containing protein n=1 Tax=Paucisalibacillus sp. EB02 TaxID=1347087 RepID=UPI0005AA8673|nr:PH domain-containing protein [Paucisalibacillus sp. EB02]